MLTTIILLYKIKLPKIQLFCLNKQLNLNLMRQFLFAHVRETKSRNLTAEKPAHFFEDFGKFHCFVFTQKRRPSAYFIPAGDTSMRARIKKKKYHGAYSCPA